jgi:hypothetical protein
MEDSNKTILMAAGSVAVVIIISVLVAYFVVQSSNSNRQVDPEETARLYNDFEFVTDGLTWITYWQRDGVEYTLEFRHPPWEVEDVPVKGSIDNRFQMPGLFITHDPTNETTKDTAYLSVAAADLATMLAAVFERQNIVAACTRNETTACATRPIVTCSTNASVIYLVSEGGKARIDLDGNCATFSGDGLEVTKAANKAIYQWLGIIR